MASTPQKNVKETVHRHLKTTPKHPCSPLTSSVMVRPELVRGLSPVSPPPPPLPVGAERRFSSLVVMVGMFLTPVLPTAVWFCRFGSGSFAGSSSGSRLDTVLRTPLSASCIESHDSYTVNSDRTQSIHVRKSCRKHFCILSLMRCFNGRTKS
jgi:hypothetical protein